MTMRCLITGGSSGIGLEMAKYLSSLGHEVVLVSKDENKLLKVVRVSRGLEFTCVI